MGRLNLCILGCGAVGRVHGRVARALAADLALWFASRSSSKAEEYMRRFGGVGCFPSYEAACADRRVDAVFVCTPPAQHAELACLAARHGKAVLIEKPVTRTLDELAAIEGAVRRAGVPCMVAENYFFKPAIAVLRQHLAAGDIGWPWGIELIRAGRQRVTGWRTDLQLSGGGALLEGGVHWINYLCSLGGGVFDVRATRSATRRPRVIPVEDGLELEVRFTSGAVGRLVHNWNAPRLSDMFRLSTIRGDLGVIRFESNGLFVLVLGRHKRLLVPGLRDLMGRRAMLQHFVDCVRNGQPPAVSLAVARRDLSIVQAAYRSLESGTFQAAA
jgi:UDP-N-acetylglucosamine 3-dehydrogenase